MESIQGMEQAKSQAQQDRIKFSEDLEKMNKKMDSYEKSKQQLNINMSEDREGTLLAKLSQKYMERSETEYEKRKKN